MRQQEAEAWEKKKKDYETGQQACAAAIKVLRQYYEGKSFLQVKEATAMRQKINLVAARFPTFALHATHIAHTIFNLGPRSGPWY